MRTKHCSPWYLSSVGVTGLATIATIMLTVAGHIARSALCYKKKEKKIMNVF